MALKKREFTPESGSVDTYEFNGNLLAENQIKKNKLNYMCFMNNGPGQGKVNIRSQM